MSELGPPPNAYLTQLTADDIAAGRHRETVGGLWDELGTLQLEYLVAQGLRPDMRLLDLGCGCLRGGLHFIRYLDPGNYFGIDVNESLLRAGWDYEIPRAGLRDRLPARNLLVSGSFEAWRFGTTFDFVLALSVFTHLPAPWLRRCLEELGRCVDRGGLFYATYFDCPADWPAGAPRPQELLGAPTFPDRDPFHYRETELRACASGLPWRFERGQAWRHPRGQAMARFVRE